MQVLSAAGVPSTARDALESRGPPKRPQWRLGRRLEGVAKAVGGGYCRLQMPLRLPLGVRGTVAGQRLGGLEGGGHPCPGPLPPPCATPLHVPRSLRLPRAGHGNATPRGRPLLSAKEGVGVGGFGHQTKVCAREIGLRIRASLLQFQFSSILFRLI